MNNHIKVAVRNLLKKKAFSAINILGLALGLATSILIFLWVRDEYSMDAFHQNGSRLYRIYKTNHVEGKLVGGPGTPPLLPAEIKKVIPEIEASSGFSWDDTHTFAAGEKIIKEKGYNASPDFFRMFSYRLLAGKAEEALNTPESIAISQAMALEFFGSPLAAVGKTIRCDNQKDYMVKAVFEDVSFSSTERFNYIANWDSFMEANKGWAMDWGNNGPRTYIMLRQGANPALVEKKIARFLDKYDKGQRKGFESTLGMQPYNELYLHGNFENGQPAGGRIEYVRLFGLVAIFILLIACINFMNLTTAHSMRRAKEIGVRKVMGAVRAALVRQFIGEAVLVALVSGILAMAFVSLALPAFNQLTGKQIELPYSNAGFWLLVAGLVIVTGIVSGSYPALFLSGFNPIRVLKGTLTPGTGSTWFRKSLVVFQFVLSIVLIISTILISRQINYIQTANLGYDRENLLYIPLEG
ncbi:MAG TPA: ABC transporter permease, partial [Chitinophagaceae bacterium]|nr:ABC transporter permease [Chitinophagaceae bacterium]